MVPLPEVAVAVVASNVAKKATSPENAPTQLQEVVAAVVEEAMVPLPEVVVAVVASNAAKKVTSPENAPMLQPEVAAAAVHATTVVRAAT